LEKKKTLDTEKILLLPEGASCHRREQKKKGGGHDVARIPPAFLCHWEKNIILAGQRIK